ncbi:MAG: EthD domain-containing protein [Alphaproteobacteria bacterium]|nr:EthD domain-containing protein [Alphaproteobacteria bacterium]
MIKLTFCLMRLPHLSREAFQDYWLDKHAPLVRSHQSVLGLRRYVQLHSFAPALSADIRVSRGAPEQYDGVAQLWWDSFEDLAKHLADPRATEAGRALLEDERKFIDLERSPLWWGEEHEIIGERFQRPRPKPSVKPIAIFDWPKGGIVAESIAATTLTVPELERRIGMLFQRSWDDLDYFDATIVSRGDTTVGFLKHLGSPKPGVQIIGSETGTGDELKAQLALAIEVAELQPNEFVWISEKVRP